MKKFGFPKKRRLSSNRQFRAVLFRRKSVSDGRFRLYAAENSCGFSRLGVSFGKVCGNSVIRNRVKRYFREAFRINSQQVPANFDYIVTVNRGAAAKSEYRELIEKLTFSQAEQVLLKLISEIHN